MILENKKNLSERDICTKFITPAIKQAGWDVLSQIREEVSFTKGRIIVRGRLVTRGKAKRAEGWYLNLYGRTFRNGRSRFLDEVEANLIP